MLSVLKKRLFGKKTFSFFITPHGGFCPDWPSFTRLSKLIKKTYTFTLGVFLINKTCDGLRAVSPWEASIMKTRGINPHLVRVITNGLENEAYQDVDKLASKNIKDIVSGIGSYIFDNSRIKPIKNIETVIRSLKQLPENIHFAHIGTTQSEKYAADLKDLAKSLGLENRVHFLGVIRGIDKYYLYKKAIALVHPAMWEANANVVHEAWSQRLITIVGDNTGMRSQVSDGVNGFRVEPKSEKELARIIMSIFNKNNPRLLESIRDQNMKYVSSHSWEKVANRMGEFYSQASISPTIGNISTIDANADFKNVIDDFIATRKTCYFISPHLDDAIFSAGSLISYLAKKTDVHVVSIFSEADAQKTLSIRVFLNLCGYRDALSLFKDRRKEDIAACEKAGAKVIHLGFTDSLWRKKKSGTVKTFFARILPEIENVYPTYRFHISNGSVSNLDSEMIDNIKRKLTDVVGDNSGNTIVFAPTAVGNHVDHVITRDICTDLFPHAIYWADVPYITRADKKYEFPEYGNRAEWKIIKDTKKSLLQAYKTQYQAVFKNNEKHIGNEIYYFRNPAINKLKISVGIPAFNEGANIKHLLKLLLSQNRYNFELAEILVISDGSTDNTVAEANSIGDEIIKVIDLPERHGKAEVQNKLLSISTGDVVVLLDADILPGNNNYLMNMIAPFYMDNGIGLISSGGTPALAQTFVENIINFSVSLKTEIFENYKGGRNIYACHGYSRAFSRALAEKLKWPTSIAEDSYSYLRSNELGYSFYYASNAKILFRSPQNIYDHFKQSSRFIASRSKLKHYFPHDVVKKCFSLPFGLVFMKSAKYFFKNPILLISYGLTYAFVHISSKVGATSIEKWDQSESSKSIIK